MIVIERVSAASAVEMITPVAQPVRQWLVAAIASRFRLAAGPACALCTIFAPPLSAGIRARRSARPGEPLDPVSARRLIATRRAPGDHRLHATIVQPPGPISIAPP